MPIFEKHQITADHAKELKKWEETGSNGQSLIAASQAKRESLHDRWIKARRKLPENELQDYRKVLSGVIRHRHISAQVRLVNHARLHRLLIGVLARLVDYAGLWERDLYFVTLALIWRAGKTPTEVFQDDKPLQGGEIIKAVHVRNLKDRDIRERLEAVFFKNPNVSIRNNLMHFNLLRRQTPPDLTRAVNDTRQLMAYDRKLKNAVSQLIIELMAREGLELEWEMPGHVLCNATVASRQAFHLDKLKIPEDLHGQPFVKMVAALFNGKLRSRVPKKDGAGTRKYGN